MRRATTSSFRRFSASDSSKTRAKRVGPQWPALPGLGFRVWGLGFLGLGWGLGFRAWGLGFRFFLGFGFLGFRVLGFVFLGFRVVGLGFRV